MTFEGKSESVAFPQIAAEMQRMVEVDQAMRKMTGADASWDGEVDVRNTARMKEIVADIGWPTTSKVGPEGASNAWLLVQHADHDVDFQEYCLGLMKEASPADVDKTDIAYLEDRVRVNRGRGQLYGTQFRQENNKHVPRPIEDEENVDARRAALGMGPLSEQVEHMYKKYPLASGDVTER